MATFITVSPVAKPKSSNDLRSQMEDLLIDFYSVVGVAPRRAYPVNAADLLADDFQGRFFIQSSSELMVFSKAQMLASKVGRGEINRPVSRLVSLSAKLCEDGIASVVYAVAYRFGQTAQVRRGSFKASLQGENWVLHSIDEDVRLVILPEVKRTQSVAADRPRLWIL
ncbi:hypothetical protein Acid345_2834 [Candidatus Koribacter versatilis Ellin345]|uniref:Uncharacterized protein n=1 Tax=Koribacter versatilis (strain Ellin345) TaxID=204669 RepID=Q1IMR5_KORVE|nr:hypothetical protein [Candidatus Koribacter versatilis]ABF41835.1 hypothetical protein Acid345_2834 [Candidatus Koribacter versatilis Ellin345]